MTKEERRQHNNEISDRFVPRLLQDGIGNEMSELTLQDLIVIRKNAEFALEKHFFVMDQEKEQRFREKIEWLRSEIALRLRKLDRLYIMYDRTTAMPYQDVNHRIYIFSEREFAEEALDYFTQELRCWEIREIEGTDIENALGQAFYLDGAKGVLIDNGKSFISLESSAVIGKPDYGNRPQVETPVTNPEFLSALATLVQEKEWKYNYPDKGKNLRLYEDAMIVAFCGASFLVPVKNMPGSGPNGATESGEAAIIIPSISFGVKKATPVFTDWRRFDAEYSMKEWEGWIWSAEELLSAPDDNIVVNSSGICFVMSKKMISQIFDIYCKERKPSDGENR